MKTRLFLTIAFALQALCMLGQPVSVTVGSYVKCDTCFTFTAHPPGEAKPGTCNYQWVFPGTPPVTDTGQVVNYCVLGVPIPFPDSMWLTLTYIDTASLQLRTSYASYELTGLLPGLGTNVTYQQICIVTVDTAVNKNMIVWEQTTDTTIVAYNLYKETSTTNVYSLLATIPRHTFSTYTDTTSHPDVKSARYYLTTLDSCKGSSGESPQGDPHKTMHLTVNAGSPPAWNLVWETYSGISFLKYRIWRKSIPNGWQLIDSVSASSTTYTDLTPPAGALSYMIEMISPTVCNASQRPSQTATAYSSSLSNVAANGVTGISENNLSPSFRLFPNPATDYLTVEIDVNVAKTEIKIFDMLGEVAYSSAAIAQKTNVIDISTLAKGMYVVQVEEGNSIVRQRFMRQ